jgi:hypothetical protein
MRIKMLIGAVAAAVLAATVSVSPAYAADGPQIGTPASPGGAFTCTEYGWATACFEKYGDKLWIYNGDWEFPRYTKNQWENWLWDGDEWIKYRWGECFDDGGGSWFVCNKDFYENTSTNYYGGKGSNIFWRACDRGASGWSCGGWRSTRNDA